MISKYAWGIGWLLYGIAMLNILSIPYFNWAIGISFIVFGISYILNK